MASLSQSPEYRAWRSMIDRCVNARHPAFSYYGGRGIVVCEQWLHGDSIRSGFVYFVLDIGIRPDASLSLDRIDNSKGYEPSNCRWATRVEQSRNRRPYVTRARRKNIGGTSTRYVGVNKRTDCNRWRARIAVGGKQRTIGTFQSAISAAFARDEYAFRNGLECRLNFPERFKLPSLSAG